MSAPAARPLLCGHHRGVFRSLDNPNGEGPVLTEAERDTWADQLADACCTARTAPTRSEEPQP